MTEEDIKQVLTSPSVVEFFRRQLDDSRVLISLDELSRRVGADRKRLSHAMDCWESSRGKLGLAFIRLYGKKSKISRLTCMSAYDDYMRREEIRSACRLEFAFRGARYSA